MISSKARIGDTRYGPRTDCTLVNASTRPITMTSTYSTAGSSVGKPIPNQVGDPVGDAGAVAPVWPVTGGEGSERLPSLSAGPVGSGVAGPAGSKTTAMAATNSTRPITFVTAIKCDG